MMKRIFAVGLILAMTASMVIGCSEKKEEETTTSSSSETTQVTTVATESESGEEKSTTGYVDEGNGDNYAYDIFTDPAQENDDSDDVKNGNGSNNQGPKNDPENDVDNETKKSENVTDKNKDEETTTNDDSGWTPFY